MIIDSESYVNVTSTTLVRRLNLNTVKNEKPCRLQWLNDCGEVRVTSRFWFLFFIKNIRRRCCVMLCLCTLLVYCWEDLGNLIEKPSTMGLRTSILLRMMGRHSYLYHYPLDNCMKIN
jgi:hypothetical protein